MASASRVRNQVYRIEAIKSGIRKIRTNSAAALALLASLVALGAASADAVGDFYKGRGIDLYIGYSAGGAYDLYARVIGRHLGGRQSDAAAEKSRRRRQPSPYQLSLPRRAA